MLLESKTIAEEELTRLKLRCSVLSSQSITPKLLVILVGDNPISLKYINNKKKACEQIGANFELCSLPTTISQEDFLKTLSQKNSDPSIHGIIIQLPLPQQLQSLPVYDLVVPEKDVDGFHFQNIAKLYQGSQDLNHLIPCTPKGILKLLKAKNINLAGKNTLVIGRSLIVGKPLSLLLTNYNATVTCAHSHSTNLLDTLKTFDLIFSAVGKAQFIKSEHLNPKKSQILIDIGMSWENNKLTGDFDKNIYTSHHQITPVPGGIGPMTVAGLMDNLIIATEMTKAKK